MPEVNDDDTYLTKTELAKRWRVTTRSIEKWAREGKCPAPYRFSSRRSVWSLKEVEAHEQAVKAKSYPKKA